MNALSSHSCQDILFSNLSFLFGQEMTHRNSSFLHHSSRVPTSFSPNRYQAMDSGSKVDVDRQGAPSSLTTGNPYEQRFGYHRAIRRGPFIFVSGTTAIDKTTGKLQAPSNASAQTAVVMEECISAVEALQGTKEDICRVRMFVAVSTTYGPCLRNALHSRIR
jgi:enamine deaminase RidA (YjgF/YER057c/UK114 family)